MPRLLSSLLSACILASAAPALAEPAFDYSLRVGHNSNLFDDTNKLSGNVIEAEAKLRGSIDIEGGQFSYGLWHREKRLSRYTFGNEHATGISLGYKTKLSDAVEFAIEGGISRNAKGDVFIAVPGTVIGYRSTDWNYNLASSLTAQMWGGKSTLSLGVDKLSRGEAHFTTNLLLPTKLEADVTAFEASLNHIRPAFSGELGVTITYRSTHIPSSEQLTLMRLPASTLRGSIAYGRKLGDAVTLVAEFGATAIMGDALGSEVKRVRPYVRTSVEWNATERLALGVGYDQDYAITDIDDPLGEYIGTLKFAAGLKIAPKLDAKVAYEIAASEWLYYVYDTRTRRLTGTLTYAFAKDHRFELEYRRVDRSESDPAQKYSGNQYLARVYGSF